MAMYVCVMHVWDPENGGERGKQQERNPQGICYEQIQRLGLKDHFHIGLRLSLGFIQRNSNDIFPWFGKKHLAIKFLICASYINHTV